MSGTTETFRIPYRGNLMIYRPATDHYHHPTSVKNTYSGLRRTNRRPTATRQRRLRELYSDFALTLTLGDCHHAQQEGELDHTALSKVSPSFPAPPSSSILTFRTLQYPLHDSSRYRVLHRTLSFPTHPHTALSKGNLNTDQCRIPSVADRLTIKAADLNGIDWVLRACRAGVPQFGRSTKAARTLLPWRA
ncbi:hypothetical protein Pelo_7853 [Pelomyxa schiedti]|nr:hypothetical protein Pelo_7853 [Pelomyxa schiedti]